MTVTSSVVLRISTRELRNFHGCYPCHQCITEEDLDQLRCRPTSCSTNYKSSTLNFDLNRGPLSNTVVVVKARSKEEAICRRRIHKLWLKRATIRLLSSTKPFENGSQSHFNFTMWSLKIHDRSCLEMSEADGVDGGAICKRGFIHLQFAEKHEAPEAERHLGSVESPLARGSPDAATSSWWDLGREYLHYAGNAYFAVESFGHSRECPTAIKSPTEGFVLFVRRLFVHAGLADLRE
ncbi:hypothetical protein V1477_008904 [Vespula maculifrons]|uniref:Uncharacterized protein n=1 Tax=Vespula maculifrons TaxID=7453 RepID=A0ABD2CEB9_VESMC